MKKHLRKLAAFILCLILMFDTFSYLGFVRIHEHLKLLEDSKELLLGIGLLSILLAILTDLVLKQKIAVGIGFGLMFLGNFGFIIQKQSVLLVAFLAYAIGTSLTKINVLVLLTKLFDKGEHKRDIALFIAMVSFIVGLVLAVQGSLAQYLDWEDGFLLTALINLFFLILFVLFRKAFKDIEKNSVQISTTPIKEHDAILDWETEPQLADNQLNMAIAPVFIGVVFLSYFSLFVGSIFLVEVTNVLTEKAENMLIAGQSFSPTEIGFIGFTIILIASIFSHVLIRKSVQKICYWLLGLSILALLLMFESYFTKNSSSISPYLAIAILFLFFILFIPTFISYLTKLTNIRYSSLVLAVFIFINYPIFTENGWIAEIPSINKTITVFVTFFMLFVLGLLGVLFQKKIAKWCGAEL